MASFACPLGPSYKASIHLDGTAHIVLAFASCSTLLRTLPLPALPPAAVRLELEVAGAAEEWGSAPDAHEVSTRTRALPLSSL